MTENIKANTKDKNKYIYNPVSQGILYFGFALSLWASDPINEPQIKGIAIFLTIVSFIFFVAVFCGWVLKLTKTISKGLAFVTFLAFVFGFITGWLQAFSQLSGIILQVIVYFGFAWLVTIILTMVKDIKSTRFRVSGSIIVIIMLLAGAVTRLCNQDYIAGGVLIAISVLIILVAIGRLKVYGSIFE